MLSGDGGERRQGGRGGPPGERGDREGGYRRRLGDNKEGGAPSGDFQPQLYVLIVSLKFLVGELLTEYLQPWWIRSWSWCASSGVDSELIASPYPPITFLLHTFLFLLGRDFLTKYVGFYRGWVGMGQKVNSVMKK